MEFFRPGPELSVLDVGVTSDDSFQESNYFEQLYPFPHRVTCIGTEDGSHLERRYPGLKYLRVAPGEPLPFSDVAFDVVFCNAVVEHVGSRRSQAEFIREVCRVGKGFFVTTPNRWFPIEHHTGVPFLHYLPPRTYRSVLARTRYRFWAEEANLNILTASELKMLFPPGVTPTIRTVSAFGLQSNLIALGRTSGACRGR